MYKRLKTRPFFNAVKCLIFKKRPITKHGAGKVERRARVVLLIGIGIGLALAVLFLFYILRVAPVLADLLPTLVKAAIIPLIIVTFYLVGVLDADEDIYKDDGYNIKAFLDDNPEDAPLLLRDSGIKESEADDDTDKE
jgi:hypothetical protein